MSSTVAAFLGALIGAGASLGGMFIQQYFQNKRDLLRIATEIATSDYKNRMGYISEIGGKMPPVSAFIHYHVQVLNLMGKDKFTPEAIEKLGAENEKIRNAYLNLSKKNKSNN